ncbi:MAG: type IX secretion system outer membrane channel protein PorV, partial [Flavobacterium sp.]
MKNLFKFLSIIVIAQYAQAQDRVITTGVPFLLIAADARSAGMADMGVATSADAYSQQFNPSKYAFSKQKQGFSMSYTPYLTSIANDISLGQVTYFNRFNDRMAFSGSLRYFGFGDIELRETGDPNEVPVITSPNEFALDGSYSLKLSPEFAMGVSGRYIRSNLKIANATTDVRPATTFAVDVSGIYQSEEVAYDNFNGRWRAGFNFQNLGPKLSYDNDLLNENFIPANMRLGGSFDFILDDYNKVSLIGETTKLLVPTPQTVTDLNNDGVVDATDKSINNQNYRNISWTSGIFKSFGDSPDGFSEELKEFTW